MIVGQIHFSKKYTKELKKVSEPILQLAVNKEKLFRENPLHPSLRLHPLKGEHEGLWSISINRNYRIIFQRMEGGDILFVSIGKHDIYRCL